MTPYTTRAGLQIGLCYVPKRQLCTFTSSEEVVQRALLARPPEPRALIRPVLGYLLALLAGVVAFFYFKG